MTTLQLKRVLFLAAETLNGQIEHFSALDAETGDGDHGVTIGKIAQTIRHKAVACGGANETPKSFFADLSAALLAIDGGSASSLWAMMADGICDALDEQDTEIGTALVQSMFTGALDGLALVSEAQLGDKTMLDALAPAVWAACGAQGTVLQVLRRAAEAAAEGAEQTRGMVARFGRAKNLRERSVGHLDPGAVSMAAMIAALYQAAGVVQAEAVE